nr:farnesyl diphosphate synthase [Thalassobacillus sp. CUG 92003]
MNDYIKAKRDLVNHYLRDYIVQSTREGRIREAMLYSVDAGGKRLRPVLMMAACEAFGGRDVDVIAPACGLEMVHTYSLIHDDLPAMDNDDFRRGSPTNHKKFDEATAILAGDALLTLSFRIISHASSLSSNHRLSLIQSLSEASGATGMVEGQMRDMQSEGQTIALEELERIHQHKTGELLMFALNAGALVGGADDKQLTALESVARHIGLIFQIQDDILDVIGDNEKLGKPIGSDEGNKKSTYPQLLGLDGAINQKASYVAQALDALTEAGVNHTYLAQLILHLSERDH